VLGQHRVGAAAPATAAAANEAVRIVATSFTLAGDSTVMMALPA
jgi:hypothetical protein